MTRNNAREIAVHLVFGLEFGARSAEEVLKRFGEPVPTKPNALMIKLRVWSEV